MRLAISKFAAFVVIISSTLVILGNSSPALAANPNGLTIITHGYQLAGVNLSVWVSEMANAIRVRSGANIPVYQVWYDRQSGGTTADDLIQLVGTGDCQDPTANIDISTGKAIILLDWAAVSDSNDGGITLEYKAQDVADRFFDCLFGRGHNGHNLAELPIHLIGHSRGASLNARLAYRLAEHGILVEQVTTLDPHPVGPWDFPSSDDLVPTTYSNVIFADNYYRTGAIPSGQSVAGTADNNLSAYLTGDGLNCPEHAQVHTYYHGTIALSVDYDGTTSEKCQIYSDWYPWVTLPDDPRGETGYNFSRYTDYSVDRPVSGVNLYLVNAGGKGSRVDVTSAFQLWPNVGFDQRSIDPLARVTVGQTYNIPYYYKDRSSLQTITFFTDSDTNPFYGGRVNIGSPVPQNSDASLHIGSATFPWTPTAADIGTRYIGAMATNTRTDLARVRYDYYLTPITVEAAPTPTPTISSISPSSFTVSPSQQTITIYGSNFTNTSTLVFSYPDGTLSPQRTPIYDNPGQLRYPATFPTAGGWKVKVVNGPVESLPFTFYVSSTPPPSATLTGLSISGPATVNENTTGLFTATALFSNGSTQTVAATWSVSGSAASINQSTGLLTAGSVLSDTPVTVSASYSAGGITKTASVNVTIVNLGGGGTQTQDLLTNGNFESGATVWSASAKPGGASTSVGILQGSYPHPPGTWYAYLGDQTTTAINAIGSLHQFMNIPANATSITLNFYLHIGTDEPSLTSSWDLMDVNVRTSSDVLIKKFRTFSEADRGVYRLVTIDMSADLLPYRGQTVLLQFYVDTDGSKYTIFRIDDVSVIATVPAPVTLSSLVINGPSSVTAGSSALYSATAVFSDGSTQIVPATGWNVSPSYASISSNGNLSAGQVQSDTVVTVSASYSSGGVTKTATKNVTIVAPIIVPTYSALFISGPSSVNENSSGQFTAVAIFSDGSSQPAPASWSLSSGVASISSAGSLTAGAVNTNTSVTVFANYTTGGVTHGANQTVWILDSQQPGAPVITSAGTAGGTVNQSFSYQITATNSPTSYGASGLPAWLSVNSSTGLISGTPTASSTFTVTVTATNAGGTGSKSVTVTITTAPGIGRTVIALGTGHTCALTATGGVKCWGANGSGQLGDGTTTARTIPVDVSGLTSGVAAIAAGDSHSCALTTAGSVKCWGMNFIGQLGDGTTTARTIPVDVSGLTSGVAAIAAGSYYTCALTATGGVKCWGANNQGQLGDNSAIDATPRTIPVDVSGLTSGVAAIAAAGQGHTCALTTAGGVKCWGSNQFGELGDNTTTTRTTPIDVSGLTSGVAAIAGGQGHTCALTTAGGVKCWGWNDNGQLGDTTTTTRTTPVDVSGLTSGVAAIAAGDRHTCALTTAGGVKCWGWNNLGQLGDTTTTTRTTPVDVSGLSSGIAAIATGVYHSCALTTAGGVKCWGYNGYGQLGDNTTINRTTPVDVLGFIAAFPNAPTIGTATAGNASISVGFTPGAPGSGTLINYTADCGGVTNTGGSSPITVTGLTNGTSYTCKVKTTTTVGPSAWSANSNSVTPSAPTLSVSKVGTGAGTVTSAPAGINCGATCGTSFTAGTTVTLTATPATGSSFTGWSGACNSSGQVTLDADKTCTATFNLITYTLTASKAGTGSGTVTSSLPGINCGATCGASFTAGTAVTLTATPATGSTFAGWSGACNSSGQVTLDADKTCTATFAIAVISGACGSSNGGTFTTAPTTNLCSAGTPTTVSGSGPWTWSCTGSNGGTPDNCSAILQTQIWTVTPSPGAGGTINPSTPVTVNNGSTTTFTVIPNNGYTASVGGTCGGNLNGTTFTTNAITANCTVSATFTTITTVILQPGPGQGKDIWTTSVYSYAPGGGGPGGGLDDDQLRVGGFGDLYYSLLQFNLSGLPNHANAVVLRLYNNDRNPSPTGMYLDRIGQPWSWVDRLWWADKPATTQWRTNSLPAPALNAWYEIDITDLYNGWQGGAFPNYGLQLRPTQNNNNYNSFYSSDYLVDPTLRPMLIITPDTTAINGVCGSSNGGTFTAAPATNLCSSGTPTTISGSGPWSWSCLGSNGGASATCTANLITYTLTVSKAGTGGGTVTSSPTGITCGADCSESYASGTPVTLTATPATGSSFTGWSGACAGSGTVTTCTITLDAAKSVTATFVTRPDLVVTAVTNPPGTARPGGSFSVTATVKNQGLASAGSSTVRYYLSLDGVQDTGDKLLSGSRSVASLATGASSTGTVTVTIPSSTVSGTYFLLACADDTKVVAESNEGNNCRSSNAQIRVGP